MGFDVLKAFATDKQAEEAGKKLVLANKGKPNESYFLIARKGNALHKALISRLLTENQATLQTKTPEAESLAQAIFREAAARHLLVGWGGIDWNGKTDVPYSFETAMEMLEVQDVYKMVDNYSDDMGNYRKEQIEAEAKN